MAVKRGAKGQASPAAKPRAARKAKAKPSPAIIAAADRAERRAGLTVAKKPEKSRSRRAGAGASASRRPGSATPAAAPKAAKPKAAAASKGGRPTDYRPEFCEQVRAYGSEGMGAAEIAAALGIKSRQTWENWKDRYPEFLDAVNDARWLAQAWYERMGRQGITMGKDFNALAWKLQVFNRFEHDYRDRREVKHDAGDGLLGLLNELDGATGRFRQAA